MIKNISVETQTNRYELTPELRKKCSGCTAQFSVELEKLSAQPAYFAITGSVSGGRYGGVSGAIHWLIHDLAAAGLLEGKDTFLPTLVRWHLTSTDGPMHYVANAIFWYEEMLRKEGRYFPSPYSVTPGPTVDPLDAFKKTVVFGAVSGDQMPVVNLPDNTFSRTWNEDAKRIVISAITSWCEARLPALMKQFEADMIFWFGPDIVQNREEVNNESTSPALS